MDPYGSYGTSTMTTLRTTDGGSTWTSQLPTPTG